MRKEFHSQDHHRDDGSALSAIALYRRRVGGKSQGAMAGDASLPNWRAGEDWV